ncbi:sensor histidine kinase [Acutalibacter sp. 1XD8-33]|uniref:sensor histidine kinase n=1 Tax=Acutalibacter sp. 1XD8-33 TaxID=2320081 RepID=UPI000EA02841|nr:sensor histidine kinase [Acutalibacter sp. 1XD8-33]RKJ40978.1 sensor histidine kinase [Acutalibacter sp. 1XD8-33]
MLLIHYIWDRRRTVLCALTLMLAAAGLFWLYRLPFIPLFYAFLILGILGAGLFGLPDFLAYHRRYRAAEKLRRMAPDLLEPVEALGAMPQKMLLESLELLRLRTAELERQLNGRQEDLLEYYTLWVHQVKTPLAAMGLILQSRPEDREALEQELFKIQRYVEMVLGYLRIHSMSADLRLEPHPVRPIAAQAVKKFAPQFIYKKLRLELEDFRNQVVTDEKWLLFVIEQLISNAIKYTPAGTITISMDENDVLTIRDTGIGIDPADLPRVCERGFTGQNGRAEAASTGLGLYLTKRVLDKLQNPMEILSQPGEGTAVKIHLRRPRLGRD